MLEHSTRADFWDLVNISGEDWAMFKLHRFSTQSHVKGGYRLRCFEGGQVVTSSESKRFHPGRERPRNCRL